jgi:hypothetical protein
VKIKMFKTEKGEYDYDYIKNINTFYVIIFVGVMMS